MKLRPATADDAEAMACVHAAAFDTPWSAGEIASLLAGPGGYAFLVGNAAGASAFILCRAIAGEAEILTLAVDPASRRQGAARALLAMAMTAARVLGATSAFLEVAEGNAAAIGLYASGGFAEVGRRRSYYAHADRPAEDALVLRLQLHA